MATWTSNIRLLIFRDINLYFHAYFNWFTACFTVQYTITTATPTKFQPRPDTINTRPLFLHSVLLEKNRPGNEATTALATTFPYLGTVYITPY